MATATAARYTAEDLLAIRDRPMPELIDGELVEREPMGQRAAIVAGRFVKFLGLHVDPLGLGFVADSQGGFQIFGDDREKVRIPDASYVRKDRLPDGKPFEGHGRVAPDLVVEVASPRDEAVDLLLKVQEFLNAGVRLVWVASVEARAVYIHRADGTGGFRKEGEDLEGEDVLPGFSVPVSALYQGF